MSGEKITGAQAYGRDLRVGDVIEVWWAPNRDVITDIKPYNGPLLTTCFPNGASIATFVTNRSGMTIDHGGVYQLLGRTGAMVPA